MLNKVIQRSFGTTFKKVKVQKPIVDIDGDEMTKIIWSWIKEKVSKLSKPLSNLTTAHFPIC